MARTFTADFEGTTVGAVITLANATGFNSVPASSSGTYEAAPVAVGTRCARVDTAAAQNSFLQRNIGTQSAYWWTFFVYVPGPPAAAVYIESFNLAGAARGSVRVNPNMTVSLRNGLVAVWTSTGTLPVGWTRVERRVDNTLGQQQVRLYFGGNVHGSTPDIDSGNVTYNAGTFDTVQFGVTTAVPNQALRLDWIAFDDATWIGSPTPTGGGGGGVTPPGGSRVLQEDFETGAAGAAVLGATEFDVEPTTGAVFTTTAAAAVGTRAVEVSTDATAANRRFQKNLAGATSLLYTSFYVHVPASPTANVYIESIQSGASARADMRINPDRTVSIRNGTTAVWTSPTPLPIGWSRIGHRLDATNSQQQVRLFLGANRHGATADVDSGNQLFNTGTFDNIAFGFTTAVAATTLSFDWIAADTAGWIPSPVAVANVPPTVSAGPDQTGVEPWATVALTAAASDADGTITSRTWAQTGGSPTVALTNVGGGVATFEAPGTAAGTTLTFTVTAVDDDGLTATDSVTVTVLPALEFHVVDGQWVPWRITQFPALAGPADPDPPTPACTLTAPFWGVFNADTLAAKQAWKAAGGTHVVIAGRWSELEPTKGALNVTALGALRQQFTDAATAGLKVIFSFSHHYTPSWIKTGSAAAPRFRNQAGTDWTGANANGNDVVDVVFSAAARAAVAGFQDLVWAALTLAEKALIEDVRIGGSLYGELHYPNDGNWWGYSAPAQTGIGLAAGMTVCPVPGHIPFVPYANGGQLSANAYSVETSAAAWEAANAGTTITRVTTAASAGSASLRMVRDLNTTDLPAARLVAAERPTAAAGQSVTVRVDVRNETTGRFGLVGIEWYDAGGTLISTTLGTSTATTSTAWTPLTVTGTAPTGTARYGVYLEGHGSGRVTSSVPLLADRINAFTGPDPDLAFTGWYLDALAAFGVWQVERLRALGYPGTAHMLHPGFGLRSNMAFGGTDYRQQAAEGVDWARQIAAYTAADPQVHPQSTWANQDDPWDPEQDQVFVADSDKASWRKLLELAQAAGRAQLLGGENTGGSSPNFDDNSDVDFMFGPRGPYANGTTYLRGINVAGGEFTPTAAGLPGTYDVDYHYDGQATFDYLAGRGHKVVRLPIRWERIQNALGGLLNTTEVTRIRDAINRAGTAGLKVILDVHNYGRYRRADDVEVALGAGITDAQFADLWTRLVNNYGANQNIWAWGLMNEPHDLAAGAWKSASQAAVNAIRAVDTTRPILVAGDAWGGAKQWATKNGADAWITDPTGNLIYEAHYYFDTDNSGQYAQSYATVNSAAVTAGYANLAARVTDELGDFLDWLTSNSAQGFIGELGWPGGADAASWNAVGETVYDLLDADGVGATYWAVGEWFGNDYALTPYTVSPYGTKAQATVLEAHPSVATAGAARYAGLTWLNWPRLAGEVAGTHATLPHLSSKIAPPEWPTSAGFGASFGTAFGA